MKSQIYLLAMALLSASAHAELGHKSPLKADFHSLIVNTYQERAHLANDVNEKLARQKVNPKPKSDDQRVTDFVDVEIGWGEAPQMVDRRFDSVGEPIISTE